MKESKSLEFKLNASSKTFLKTVSAFSNYDGGRIIFGIDDDGNIKGVDDPKQVSLSIENSINDNIKPQPRYSIEINTEEKTVILEIMPGIYKPYLYNSKAYKRNDTSTIEVDTYELTRLVLEGKKINFEELPSSIQNLEFTELATRLREVIDVEKFDLDTLKTLRLLDKSTGFNNAANILSDNNTFNGIDIAKFGDNLNVINKRLTLNNMSILKAFDEAVQIYKDYYQYEEIIGTYRQTRELIPEEAYREAVANALIHREWDVNAQVRISMYDDRIEIVSPGGLLNGITEEEYTSGRLSMLRNPILSNVFYRLGIVEIFGTGIPRIINSYFNSIKKPKFNVSVNSILVTLPVIVDDLGLTDEEQQIYNLLSRVEAKSIGQLLPYVKFSKSKLTKLLQKMEKQGIVKISGNGRGTKYHL